MLKNYSIRRFTGLTVAIALLLASAGASMATDEQRYYDIEILFFEHTSSLRNLPELTDSTQPLQLPEKFIQLGVPVSTESHGFIPENYFRLLPPDSYHLNEAAVKISQTGQFRILKHVAWRQPGLEKSVALPILLQEVFLPQETDDGNSPQPASAPLYTSARLDGLVTVSLSRYLHLETNLRYAITGLAQPQEIQQTYISSQQSEFLPSEKPSVVVYHLQQKRRMRSKELHYIDHPVIGMLVYMTPVEIPAKAN